MSKPKDADFDPTYDYHEEWEGLIYSRAFEAKLRKQLSNVPPHKALFANSYNYKYYSAFYHHRQHEMEARKDSIVRELHSDRRPKDPLQHHLKQSDAGTYSKSGWKGKILGMAGVGSFLYTAMFVAS